MDGSLVFYNARLLYTFHKLLQMHESFRQLEALHRTFIMSSAIARAFPLLVPVDPTDESFQLRSSVCLWTVCLILAQCTSILSWLSGVCARYLYHKKYSLRDANNWNNWRNYKNNNNTVGDNTLIYNGLTCIRSASVRESTNDLTICRGKMSESVL